MRRLNGACPRWADGVEREGNPMSNVPELFGCMVFDDKVMRARLSADVYRSLRSTMNKGKKLDLSLANAVAAAMCE